MSFSYYKSQSKVQNSQPYPSHEFFDSTSDLASTYSTNNNTAPSNNVDNFGYSPEYQKNADNWWKSAPADHPGIKAHREAHDNSTWSGGRFIAPNTSQCTTNESCFNVGKVCDSGLAFATDCIAYEPWRVQCDSGRCIVDG